MKPIIQFPISSESVLCLLPAFLAVCLAAAQPARADVIATEDFDSYTTGTLATQGSTANGWGGAWVSTQPTIIVSDNAADLVAYSAGGVNRGSADSGKVLKFNGTADGNTTLSRLIEEKPEYHGKDIYMSFIFKVWDPTVSPGDNLSAQIFSAWYAKDTAFALTDAAGVVCASGRTTARVNSADGAVTTYIKNGVVHFFVIKYIWNPDVSAYRSVRVWLNPTVNDEGATNTAMTNASTPSSNGSDKYTGISVRTYGIAGGTGGGRYQVIDDIRIGTTWANIVGAPTLLPPTVTSVAPVSGLYPGDTITIIGTNFADETAVTIGGYTAVKTLDVTTPSTKMTVAIPANAIGEDLAVVVRNGMDSVTATDTITVSPFPPTVTSVTPATSSPGDSITIAGENLNNATVTIGTETATITANTATSITAAIPEDMAGGTYAVTVTTSAGSASGSVTLTLDPSIAGVVPLNAAPGELITINGNFLDDATVTIGGVPATVLRSASNRTSLKVFVPDNTADGVVVVTTPSGIITAADQITIGGAGVLLASDDFENDIYTSTTNTFILGKNGGTGWGEAWKAANNSMSITDTLVPCLTLSDGTVVGGGKGLKVAAASNAAFARAINAPVTDGRDVFMSFVFMIKNTNAEDGTDLSGNIFTSWGATVNTALTNYDTANAGTALLVGSGGKVGARVKGASNVDNSFADPLKNGQFYFVVVKYTGWNAGAGRYGKCQVWLNPRVDDEGSTDGTVTRTSTNTGNGSLGFGGFGVRSFGLNSNIFQVIDAIRIGTSWSSVVSVAKPVIADASPLNAHPGDVVTLSGGGLSGLQMVKIGGKQIDILSATNAAIKIAIPIDAVGANQEIALTFSGETDPMILPDRLNVTLTAPVIDSISYAGQTVARDQTITITGNHFTGYESVKIAGIIASLAPSTTVTNTEIKVKVPATAPAGLASLEVKTIGGIATQSNVFTVDTVMKPLPILQQVKFAYPTAKPGDQVTLVGENFTQPATIKINGIAAQIVSLEDGEIVVAIPGGANLAGNTTIVIETSGGIATSAPQSWEYSTMPVITLQPVDSRLAVTGSTRGFDLVASATATSDMAYQWQFLDPATNIWRPVNGATNSVGRLAYSGTYMREQQIRCAISTRLGRIYTNPTTIIFMEDILPAPSGIAISDGPDYQIYVSDTSRHIVQSIAASGSVALLAGFSGTAGNIDGTGAEARFNKPRGLSINSDGILLVADSGNNIFRAVTTEGVVTATGTGIDAVFLSPAGLASVDASNGATYVADTGNHLIKKISPAGEVSIVAGAAVSGTADGALLAAQFNSPASVAVDVTGNYIYVADTQNHAIRLIDLAAATVSTFAGQIGTPGVADGDALTEAGFTAPSALVVDEAGNVFVADTGNSRIRAILTDQSFNRNVYTAAGAMPGFKDGAFTDAWFRNPDALALKDGDLYVADTGNGVIRKIALETGTVTTIEVHGSPAPVTPPADTTPHSFPDSGGLAGGVGGGGASSLWFFAALALLAGMRLRRRQ